MVPLLQQLANQKRPRRPPLKQVMKQGDIDISDAMRTRLATAAVSLNFVERLAQDGSLGITTERDLQSLITMKELGCDEQEISWWARLGTLTDAAVLCGEGLTPDRVAGLGDLISVRDMLTKCKGVGIHPDDLKLWHVAGVLDSAPPFLKQDMWRPWRRVVASIGARKAAIAAAAGLTPEAAITAYTSSDLDEGPIVFMANLRAGAILVSLPA